MSKGKRKLVQTNVRLYEDNVKKLKEIADATHGNYHALIRKAVDEWLNGPSKVG